MEPIDVWTVCRAHQSKGKNKLKDRISSFRRIKASLLKRNAGNWREHTESQETALRAILNEVGFASACLVRDCKNGTYELIDGHLRADIAEDERVPCLILNVTKKEADKILATFDVVGTMAKTDQLALDRLIGTVSTESEALRNLLDSIKREKLEVQGMCEADDEAHLLVDSYRILINCENEAEQVALLKRFKKEGVTCRAWIS